MQSAGPVGRQRPGHPADHDSQGRDRGPHLLRITELAEIYGDKCVYSNNRQNLVIH
jgi:hypothetical protein